MLRNLKRSQHVAFEIGKVYDIHGAGAVDIGRFRLDAGHLKLAQHLGFDISEVDDIDDAVTAHIPIDDSLILGDGRLAGIQGDAASGADEIRIGADSAVWIRYLHGERNGCEGQKRSSAVRSW